jgi:TPR repeat protein
MDEAMNAYRQGDRATAFTEFHALAEQKYDLAYGKLASMYLYGLGTEKNYKKAYIWFHMAYLTGDKNAERFRTAATSMMSKDVYQDAVVDAEKQRIKLGLDKIPRRNDMKKQVLQE